MDEQMQMLLKLALDIQKSKNTVDAQIKEISSKASKLEVGITVSKKSAKDAINTQKQLQKEYYNYLNNLKKEYESADKRQITARNQYYKKQKEQQKQIDKDYQLWWKQSLRETEKQNRENIKQNNTRFDAKNLDLNKSIAINKMQGWLRENSKAAKRFSGQINEIIAKVKTADKAQLKNLRKEFATVTTRAESLGKTGRSVFKEITHDMGKMKNWLLGGTLLFGTFRQIKSGINYVKELDSALTTINMTMPVTEKGLVDIANKSNKMAKQLGTSAADTLRVAQIYANVNESVQGMLDKTKPTLMLSTASGMDASAAADTLQALTNQFGLTEDAGIHLTDVLEKVSANMKVEFGKGIVEITEGIKASGAVAKEAGYGVEEYSAILGSLVEKTRMAGSKLGNGLKMIFSRMGRASSPDVTAEDVSKTEKAFKSVGIALRDVTGNFRAVPKVLDELHTKWDKLNSVQRSHIAEQAAGVKQKNIFLQLMNSYKKSIDLTTQAENANGFAMEVNEKRMESIDAKTKVFQATLDGMWKSTINDNAIKGVVEGGTGIVSFLDSIIKNLGLIPTLATAAAGALSFKNVGKQIPNIIGYALPLKIAS